jgi:heme/copper-type cytochrome/quinol oxidase subunit 2
LKKLKVTKPPKLRLSVNPAKAMYTLFLVVTMAMMFAQPAFAATDVWTKASEIMKDVYNQILLISTIAAIVTASVALLMMNFSRSGRTVDESRAWLKRIIITWVVLNGLGFIMAYVTPFFADGKWNG